MSKMVTVRIEERELERLEQVRDPQRYPTQSAFVREAVRRLVQEERRQRIAAEAKRLAGDPAEVALAQGMAEAGLEEWAAALDGPERKRGGP